MLFSSQDFNFTYILYHRSYNPSDFTSLFVSSICSSAFSLIIESVVLVSSLTVLWQALMLQAIHITPANSNPLYRLIMYLSSPNLICLTIADKHHIYDFLYRQLISYHIKFIIKWICTKRPVDVQINICRSFYNRSVSCYLLLLYPAITGSELFNFLFIFTTPNTNP